MKKSRLVVFVITVLTILTLIVTVPHPFARI